ncbi:MAG TPA: hypothetical protein VFI28_10815 [Candidatus Limnocylindrales bacterium]|nr:hypothetical protein [Candidatus Limnocylindrales bacterium]
MPTTDPRRPLRRPAGARDVADAVPSPGRGFGLGLITAVLLGAILAILGGPVSLSAGLAVVAFFLGRLVGTMVRVGAAGTLSSPARVSLAIALSLAGVALGQLGIWVFARSEGGTLDLGAYLFDAFGPLVPLEFMIATLSAWWSAR